MKFCGGNPNGQRLYDFVFHLSMPLPFTQLLFFPPYCSIDCLHVWDDGYWRGDFMCAKVMGLWMIPSCHRRWRRNDLLVRIPPVNSIMTMIHPNAIVRFCTFDDFGSATHIATYYLLFHCHCGGLWLRCGGPSVWCCTLVLSYTTIDHTSHSCTNIVFDHKKASLDNYALLTALSYHWRESDFVEDSTTMRRNHSKSADWNHQQHYSSETVANSEDFVGTPPQHFERTQ